MKLIGRVVLIIVGVLCLIAGVTAIGEIVENGFNGNFASIRSIVLAIFLFIAGVVGILCGVFGKISFKLMICAIILLILGIIALVSAIIDAVNGISSWQAFVSSIWTLLVPFGYYLGYRWIKK